MSPAKLNQKHRQHLQQPLQSSRINFISDIITKFETKTTPDDHVHKNVGNDCNAQLKLRKHFSARQPLVQFEMHPRECDSDDQEIFYNSNGSAIINGGHSPQINFVNRPSTHNHQNLTSPKCGRTKFDRVFQLLSWLPLSLLTLTGMGVTCLVGAFFLPRAISQMILYPGFRLLFGTLYPAYASYKAVRTKNVKEYVSTLYNKFNIYFLLFVFFFFIIFAANIPQIYLLFYK